MAMPKFHRSPNFLFEYSKPLKSYIVTHLFKNICVFSVINNDFDFSGNFYDSPRLTTFKLEELARHGTFLHELFKYQSNEQTNQKKAT